MVSNFQDIVDSLQKYCEKDKETKPQQFKEAVLKIAASLHDKLNSAKDKLIDYGIKAFEKEDKHINENFKLPDDSDKSKNIKVKVHELVASIDGMLKRTEFLDDSIKIIKNDQTEKLLVMRKGVLNFKITIKFQMKVDGKANADLGWLNPQNNPSGSSIDSIDGSILKIMGTGCYNYYQTNKEFTTEDVDVELVTNGFQENDYFYFGVRNETTVPSSNCMCSNHSSIIYFRSSGVVCQNGTTFTESKLAFSNTQRANVRIRIRLLCSEKKVFFEVDGKGECGPYTLNGSKFTITSGSCNECNGFIKIDSAQLV